MPIQDYAERKAEKLERNQERASKARAEAQRAYNESTRLAEMIPFGQPILVGHHSEKGHRAHINKIHSKMGKAIELDKKADYYESKGQSTAISSDDPEAVRLLKEKLAGLERSQAMMKEANKLVKKNDIIGIISLGYSETQAREILKPDFCGRIGFASYVLTNNNANIKTVQKRIDALTKQAERATQPPQIVRGRGWSCKESHENNRFLFIFDAIPSEEVRSLLKCHGFKWSPTTGAWVRMMTANAAYSSRLIIKKLNELQ